MLEWCNLVATTRLERVAERCVSSSLTSSKYALVE